MAAWIMMTLVLCSCLTCIQSLSCSDLTQCRTLTQEHCQSSGVLCVGYNDCKSCLRRGCDKDDIPCTTGSQRHCAVERPDAIERQLYCSRPESSETLEKCQKPTGRCDWYTSCMYRYFPACSGSKNYALTYGQKYCDKYTENISKFSPKGKLWIDRVRQCLQDALAPQLSALSESNCKGARKAAFDSHPICYTDPSEDSSVCELECGDMYQVLATTKGGFSPFGGAFFASLNQARIVRERCMNRKSGLCFKVVNTAATLAVHLATRRAYGVAVGTLRLIKLYIEYRKTRPKRDVTFDEDEQSVANQMVEDIFNQTGLVENQTIQWFAFPKEIGDSLEINVVITETAFADPASTTTLGEAQKSLQAAAVIFFEGVVKQKKAHQVLACEDLACQQNSTKTAVGKADGKDVIG